MWTANLKGVPRAVNQHAVAIGNNIYSFYLSHEEKDFIDVYIFNSLSYEWHLVKTHVPSGGRQLTFFGCNVVAYGDYAYVYSGSICDRPLLSSSLSRFDASTLTWTFLEMSGDVPRTGWHSACTVGHRMYIIGGYPEGSSEHVYFLDLDALKWHRVPATGDAPTGLIYHSTSAIGSRIYVWGGMVEHDLLAHNYCVRYLDTVTCTWVRLHVEGMAPECRAHHTSFVYKGEMYIFGGYSRHMGIQYADLHKYDPEKSFWTRVRPKRSGPWAHGCHACCVIGNRVFIIGGVGSKPIRGGQATGANRELFPFYRLAELAFTKLHVLDFEPTLQTLCLVAIADSRVEYGLLPPIIEKQIRAMKGDDSN
ncbi:hypothetical protein V5799_027646 [Amblyomma americanum]|uniref:Kelch domain-containing protein 3 n=1 Tax=Amblyomma americanum TaxID=6943 RepID=A0AAQ4DF41_AMBAM